MKTRMQIVQEGAKTSAAKNAIKQIQELKSIVNDMRARKVYAPNVQMVERDGLLAIKSELLSSSKMENERISKRLGQLENDYRKKLKEANIDYSSIIAHYSGMSDDELRQEEAQLLINPRVGRDPISIDYLCSELRQRGIEAKTESNGKTVSAIRTKLNEANYLAPWTHSPEGSALSRESTFYDSARPGDFLIEAMNQQGQAGTVAVNVDGLYYE